LEEGAFAPQVKKRGNKEIKKVIGLFLFLIKLSLFFIID
jgi:hypothetical protein